MPYEDGLGYIYNEVLLIGRYIPIRGGGAQLFKSGHPEDIRENLKEILKPLGGI